MSAKKKTNRIRVIHGPSDLTIRRTLKELRELIDTSKDPYEQRIAYAMETAITWAREDTIGWPKMVNEAKSMAQMIRNEL